MNPVIGRVTGYQLIAPGYIQVSISEHQLNAPNNWNNGTSIASIRLPENDAPKMGALVEISVRITG